MSTESNCRQSSILKEEKPGEVGLGADVTSTSVVKPGRGRRDNTPSQTSWGDGDHQSPSESARRHPAAEGIARKN